MKNLFLSLVVIFAATSVTSFADKTNCSDPTGQWNYQTSTYEGGVAPQPTQVTYKKLWSNQGKAFEELQGTPSQPIAEADVVDTIDSKTATELESHGNEDVGGVTFAQLVTLKRKSGGSVLPNSANKTVSVYMICASSWERTLP